MEKFTINKNELILEVMRFQYFEYFSYLYKLWQSYQFFKRLKCNLGTVLMSFFKYI